MRAQNNLVKREFLNQWVPRGATVLDVGCGQGGDIHKWRHIGVSKLVGVDPNPWAIQEARRRSQGSFGEFHVGDICSAPHNQLFDVVCYNFSLQYQSLELLDEVTSRLRSDGKGLFLGIVTDSTRLDEASANGIDVQKVDSGHIRVYIPDTPYYANGPIVEPILDKHEFIRKAEQLGLVLKLWEPFSMYAKFVFSYAPSSSSDETTPDTFTRGSHIHTVDK